MPDVFIKMFIKRLYEIFKEHGGWSSKRNYMWILLILYAFYSLCKTKGYLPKKSLKGKHVFITGAGSGLGRLLS